MSLGDGAMWDGQQALSATRFGDAARRQQTVSTFGTSATTRPPLRIVAGSCAAVNATAKNPPYSHCAHASVGVFDAQGRTATEHASDSERCWAGEGQH
jgi:hypothetical protein